MSDTATARPIPKQGTYVDSAPFWEGAKKQELWLQVCEDTGKFQHYPRPVSIYTGSRNLGWRQVSGNGVIYARTVLRIPGVGTDGRLPLPIATIDLDEGARILGNIIDAEVEDVKIGCKVKVAWELLGEDIYYPAFRLA